MNIEEKLRNHFEELEKSLKELELIQQQRLGEYTEYVQTVDFENNHSIDERYLRLRAIKNLQFQIKDVKNKIHKIKEQLELVVSDKKEYTTEEEAILRELYVAPLYEQQNVRKEFSKEEEERIWQDFIKPLQDSVEEDKQTQIR